MDYFPHIHLVAIHAEPGRRSVAPGLGLLCCGGDFLAGAGVFQNSAGARSSYATIGWQSLSIGAARVGAFAGLIDGYNYQNGAAFPFAGGLASVPFSWGEIHLTFVPPVQSLSPATLGVSAALKWR